jgi:hypothetical protein
MSLSNWQPDIIGISFAKRKIAIGPEVIEATEIVGRWGKRRKKDCTGARPHNRLGPVGPF